LSINNDSHDERYSPTLPLFPPCPVLTGRGRRETGRSSVSQAVQTHLHEGDRDVVLFEGFDNFQRIYGETSQHWGSERDYRDANWTARGYSRSAVPRSLLAVAPDDKPLWPRSCFMDNDDSVQWVVNAVAQATDGLTKPTALKFTQAVGCMTVPIGPKTKADPLKQLKFVPVDLLDENLARNADCLRVPPCLF